MACDIRMLSVAWVEHGGVFGGLSTERKT